MKEIKLNVEIPEGYEPTGEVRHANHDDLYLGGGGEAETWKGKESACLYIILRKVWVPEPGDVVCLMLEDEYHYRVFSHFEGGYMCCISQDCAGADHPSGRTATWHNNYSKANPSEVIKLERPRYKSFEIDWNECNVPIIQIAISEKAEERVEAKNGQKIGDYRIIRFGDNEDYAANPYDDNVPSHQAGNYKYAYGRLEK